MSEWGPLQGLIGEWQGEGGLDKAFNHERQKVLDTPYLEKVSMKPFGPVNNGRQELFGLDYKTAMWRGSEDDPFHTEVGYWLWDATTGSVMRGFVVPRGITVLAGGNTTHDATSFSMSATLGDKNWGISENEYLSDNASTVRYSVDITIIDDNSWSYSESTILQQKEIDGEFDHSDSAILHRIS